MATSPINNTTVNNDQYDSIDYKEIYVWSLTSSTNIYSGVNTIHSKDNDTDVNVLRWATQYHTCSIDFNHSFNQPHQPMLQSQLIPLYSNEKERSMKKHCVGYITTKHWEVITLFDTSKISVISNPNPSQNVIPPPPPQLHHHHHQQSSSLMGLSLNDDDNYSVNATTTTTTATTSTIMNIPSGIMMNQQQQSQPQPHHRRNSSFSSIPESIVEPDVITNSTSNNMNDSMSNLVQYTSFYSDTTTNTTNNMNNTINDYVSLQQQSLSTPPSISITNMKKIGKLIIRRIGIVPTITIEQNENVSTATTNEIPTETLTIVKDSIPIEYSTYIDFRPLAIAMSEIESQLHIALDNRLDDTTISIVWLGSADQNQLYCYTPCIQPSEKTTMTTATNTGGEKSSLLPQVGSLIPIDIKQHESFILSSPVMAIQSLNWLDESSNDTKMVQFCVVVACQDGTVRLITFHIKYNENDKPNMLLFHNVQHNQVIIDGPIVTLHVRRVALNADTTDSNKIIHVTVGSLCGYVAELYLNPYDMQFIPKEGPTMVVQGFWNSSLQVDDSIMAVYRYKNLVCVGTQAGRCYIFSEEVHSRTSNDESMNDSQLHGNTMKHGSSSNIIQYKLMWSCQLSYPIHAILLLPDDQLIVTTRRSVHMFQRRFRSNETKTSISAKAQCIKQKIEALLRDQEEKKKEQQQRIAEIIISEQPTDPLPENSIQLELSTMANEKHSESAVIDDNIVSELLNLV